MYSLCREDIYNIYSLFLENQADNPIPKHPVIFIYTEKSQLSWKKEFKYVIYPHVDSKLTD